MMMEKFSSVVKAEVERNYPMFVEYADYEHFLQLLTFMMRYYCQVLFGNTSVGMDT